MSAFISNANLYRLSIILRLHCHRTVRYKPCLVPINEGGCIMIPVRDMLLVVWKTTAVVNYYLKQIYSSIFGRYFKMSSLVLEFCDDVGGISSLLLLVLYQR